MNKQQHDVLEFQEQVIGLAAPRERLIFLGPVNIDPDYSAAEDRKMVEGRIVHLQEELEELTAAVRRGDMAALIDGLVDLQYVIYDFANRLGVDLEPFWDEVHRSNMTKQGGALNAEGKFIKPPTYTPADIAGVLRKVERSCSIRRTTRHIVSEYELKEYNAIHHYIIRPDVEFVKAALQEIMFEEGAASEGGDGE
jgi:NTP pyrophosphatase (non-canonical NTP hydrolase)